jgi:hypothetical protein
MQDAQLDPSRGQGIELGEHRPVPPADLDVHVFEVRRGDPDAHFGPTNPSQHIFVMVPVPNEPTPDRT